MPESRKTKASEVAGKVLRAKAAWEDAKLRLDQAKTEFEYAQQLLVLARRELELERARMSEYDDDWDQQVTQGYADPVGVLDALSSIEFVDKPIGTAARAALRQLQRASVPTLVVYMESKGFKFGTDTPAREIHGALVKQGWAKKNPKTEQWEYVIAG